jgi:hypothetical protein
MILQQAWSSIHRCHAQDPAVGLSNVGSVNSLTLRQVWNGQELEELRSNLIERRRSANRLCAKCDCDDFRTPYHYAIPFTRARLLGSG